jgi:hypothetical protein
VIIIADSGERAFEDNSNTTLAKFYCLQEVAVHQSTGDIFVIDKQNAYPVIRKINTGKILLFVYVLLNFVFLLLIGFSGK